MTHFQTYYFKRSLWYYINAARYRWCRDRFNTYDISFVLVVQCDASYNSIDNGITKGVQGGNACNNTYNCRLDFECLPGYEFPERQSTIAVCQYDGTWNSKKPVCQHDWSERVLKLWSWDETIFKLILTNVEKFISWFFNLM